MNKEKIKSIIIFVLLGVVILFIGVFYGMSLGKKPTEQPVENNEVEEAKELSTEEVLSSMVGEWGTCLGEYDCRGLIVGKNGNEYYYTPYVMWSEFGDKGTIEKVTKVEDNNYKLTVHYPGYSDELGSAPERTVEYTVNISETASKILYVDSKKYQQVNGDRETFFKSIM